MENNIRNYICYGITGGKVTLNNENPRLEVTSDSLERVFRLLDIVETDEVTAKTRELIHSLGDCLPKGNEDDTTGISYEEFLAITNLVGCTREEALEFKDLITEVGGLDQNQSSHLLLKYSRGRFLLF